MAKIDPASRSAFKMAGVAGAVGAGVAGAVGLKKLSDIRTSEYRSTAKLKKFARKGDTGVSATGTPLVFDGTDWVAQKPKKK